VPIGQHCGCIDRRSQRFAPVAQGGRHSRKLVQRRLEVLNDLGRDDLGCWQIVAVLQGLVPEPEDVQGRLVAANGLFIPEGSESVGLGSLVPVGRVVATNEVLKIGAGELLASTSA
jgi:hypothetical protein